MLSPSQIFIVPVGSVKSDIGSVRYACAVSEKLKLPQPGTVATTEKEVSVKTGMNNESSVWPLDQRIELAPLTRKTAFSPIQTESSMA